VGQSFGSFVPRRRSGRGVYRNNSLIGMGGWLKRKVMSCLIPSERVRLGRSLEAAERRSLHQPPLLLFYASSSSLKS
jgi:hypothetical protein